MTPGSRDALVRLHLGAPPVSERRWQPAFLRNGLRPTTEPSARLIVVREASGEVQYAVRQRPSPAGGGGCARPAKAVSSYGDLQQGFLAPSQRLAAYM